MAADKKYETGGAELVIVGASLAGGFLIRQLISTGTWSKFQTVVIDKNEYLEWFLGVDRYLCDEELAKKHLISTQDYFDKNKMAQYNIHFVQGTVTNITSDGCESGGIVEYTTPAEQSCNTKSPNDDTKYTDKHVNNHRLGTEVSCNVKYQYLVIATGAQYGSPIKDHNRDTSARLTELGLWRSRLSGAGQILIVGGGPVGVELAGGLAHKFRNDKSKKVHLVTRSKQLLERLPPEAGQYAEKALGSLGVTLHMGKEADSVTRELSTSAPSSEIVMLPRRTHFNSSFLENNTFRGSLATNGAIKVNSFMQVDSFRNVFALGDCCVTPVVEEKGVVAINQLGRVVWRNLVNKHDAERLITVPPRTELLQAVTIGREDGLLVVNWKLMMTGARVAKMKDETLDQFGNLEIEAKGLKRVKTITSVLSCLSSVLCCGCAISSRERERALLQIASEKKVVTGQPGNKSDEMKNGNIGNEMTNGHHHQNGKSERNGIDLKN